MAGRIQSTLINKYNQKRARIRAFRIRNQPYLSIDERAQRAAGGEQVQREEVRVRTGENPETAERLRWHYTTPPESNAALEIRNIIQILAADYAKKSGINSGQQYQRRNILRGTTGEESPFMNKVNYDILVRNQC